MALSCFRIPKPGRELKRARKALNVALASIDSARGQVRPNAIMPSMGRRAEATVPNKPETGRDGIYL